MAVVKSDGYGHGAATTAQLFEASGVDYLGVASIDEGLQLRQSGIKLPVLVLSPTPSWAIDTALENNLGISITSLRQIEDVSSTAKRLNLRAAVHIKIDTGMHRLGIEPASTAQALELIDKDPNLQLMSVYSHLAMADNREAVDFQKDRFDKAIKIVPPGTILHLASSEATRLFPDTHYDMVRVGLYLWGLAPNTILPELRPALSLKARINHIGPVPIGESAGYGFTWTAKRESRLAMIPIGYADGVDRGLSNCMEAIIEDKLVKQVGRISMDQMLLDITDCKQAQEGDLVTLIGGSAQKSINLCQWAERLDTITYELACRLRARLPKVYTRERLR
ncbi:MAG: alanine racemase [Candidatus Obscuribacterales bacterium]|nr:alanine racemase [Candidatus Obscuribacterales bacterium]